MQRHTTMGTLNMHEQRESRVLTQVLHLAVLALAAGWLAGCSTTVYKQGDSAAGSSRTAAMQIKTESQALAGTMTTLNDLVDKPAADLRQQFQCFSAGLDSLIAAEKRGPVTEGHMVHINAAYFAAWDKQLTTITNADVRSSSETRRADVNHQFNAANQRYVQAQDALHSLVDYLQDIRKALTTDLTMNGVQAMKPLVSNANTTANKVQAVLAQANTDLTALSTRMSSAGGPSGQ